MVLGGETRVLDVEGERRDLGRLLGLWFGHLGEWCSLRKAAWEEEQVWTY